MILYTLLVMYLTGSLIFSTIAQGFTEEGEPAEMGLMTRFWIGVQWPLILFMQIKENDD